MMWKFAALITATLALTPLAYAQENVPEPEGYRTDNYRADSRNGCRGTRSRD